MPTDYEDRDDSNFDDGLIHRDDLPYPVVEGLEAFFKEKFGPNVKVRFAGDNPEAIPPEIRKELLRVAAAFRAQAARSIVDGVCAECGVKIPTEWPPQAGSKIPKGWACYYDVATDVPSMLVCPKCEANTPKVGVTHGDFWNWHIYGIVGALLIVFGLGAILWAIF